jgi:hypothetical protein
MIEFDKVLLEFVGGNWMSIYVVITLAKGIALITPTVKDDAIITLLYQLFGVVRGGKEPVLNAKSGGKHKMSKAERLELWKEIEQKKVDSQNVKTIDPPDPNTKPDGVDTSNIVEAELSVKENEGGR